MKLAEMIAMARVAVDDAEKPYKCSDEQFTRFANWSENEAVRRGRLILDSSTPEICVLNIGAGDETVDLDPRILFIRRAKLTGRALPLKRKHVADMDCEQAGWESTTGEISNWVTGLSDDKFRPFPIPTVASEVTLTVARLPLQEMVKEGDEPEIRAHLHDSLVDGMRYRYYSLPDKEIYDPKAAAAALVDFEEEFGKKSSALDEQWLAREADHYEAEGTF